MNYSVISKMGKTNVKRFDLGDDSLFRHNDIKETQFKFDLSNPNFHDEEVIFGVDVLITNRSLWLQKDILILRTETAFRIKDFNLSHNTEILFQCCQIAFDQTLVEYTNATIGLAIQNIHFSFDKYRLETDLETYMHGYFLELKNYLRLNLK